MAFCSTHLHGANGARQRRGAPRPSHTTRALIATGIAVSLLAGCSSSGPSFVAEVEPWRAQSEQACLARERFETQPGISTVARRSLGGPKICGAIRPFRVASLGRTRPVTLKPAATLRCTMVPAVERWLDTVVQPAALAAYGEPVAEIKVAASYACRPMNHRHGARLSEHGHANALDVSGFELASGRRIILKSGWNGARADAAFLRAVHTGSCGVFTTVLGPEHDRLHEDHFHFDLAKRRRGRSYCR